MAKNQWYNDVLNKINDIEDYRISKKKLSGQLLIDQRVAKNMLMRNLTKSYKKVTKSHERVKIMAHVDKLYLIMEKDKVKNVVN